MQKSKVNRAHKGWRTIGDAKEYFKSDWEVTFARFLQILKENNQIKEWEYEAETFWFMDIKRGTRSYLPDFKITKNDGKHYWAEVKGYIDPKSKTKIKRFAKYYPEEQLVLITKKWFKENGYKIPKEKNEPLLEKKESPLPSRN